MDVTFTTEPLTALSSFISPRASMIGAKKFTWNTWCQTSIVVSSEPSRTPPLPLGEIAALFTSACSSWLSSRRRISSIAASVLASSARSTWM
jgi:hypothetical protein